MKPGAVYQYFGGTGRRKKGSGRVKKKNERGRNCRLQREAKKGSEIAL